MLFIALLGNLLEEVERLWRFLSEPLELFNLNYCNGSVNGFNLAQDWVEGGFVSKACDPSASVWLGLKGTRATPICTQTKALAPTAVAVACVWAWFPPNARENSKYPTICSQLFVFKLLNFSHYIHCRTKVFWLLLVLFSYWIRLTSDLNISFIRKRNWTCEYITFIPKERRTHPTFVHVILSTDASIQFEDSLKKFFIFQ